MIVMRFILVVDWLWTILTIVHNHCYKITCFIFTSIKYLFGKPHSRHLYHAHLPVVCHIHLLNMPTLRMHKLKTQTRSCIVFKLQPKIQFPKSSQLNTFYFTNQFHTNTILKSKTLKTNNQLTFCIIKFKWASRNKVDTFHIKWFLLYHSMSPSVPSPKACMRTN